MEIERRYLVLDSISNNLDINSLPYSDIQQGYLYIDRENNSCFRVRIQDERSMVTIKKKISERSSEEFEYDIPYCDAEYMLNTMLCGYCVKKRRYYYQVTEDICFEIDYFYGANQGLIIAEVELPSENYSFDSPSWLGLEVTADVRYTNAMLSLYPFSSWSEQKV